MKRITYYALTLAIFAFGQLTAQTASQDFDNAIASTGNIKNSVTVAKKAVGQLAKQLVILGNPDAQLFYDKMFAQVNIVQNNADDVDYFVSEAQNVTTIPFSSATVNAITTNLVSLNDELIGLTYEITEAINDNNTTVAVNLLPQVNAVLESQNTQSDNLIAELNALKQATKTYNVCIELVDNFGNPVIATDLFGYYAYVESTSTNIQTDTDGGSCFTGLTDGTYAFHAYNGYFSGASVETITLSDALVNSDGVIVVKLVYWSE